MTSTHWTTATYGAYGDVGWTVTLLSRRRRVCEANLIAAGDKLALAGLHTTQDYRGQGYARELLEHIVETVSDWDLDFKYIELEVRPPEHSPLGTPELIRFYSRVGFEVDPTHADAEAPVMRLNLTKSKKAN